MCACVVIPHSVQWSRTPKLFQAGINQPSSGLDSERLRGVILAAAADDTSEGGHWKGSSWPSAVGTHTQKDSTPRTKRTNGSVTRVHLVPWRDSSRGRQRQTLSCLVPISRYGADTYWRRLVMTGKEQDITEDRFSNEAFFFGIYSTSWNETLEWIAFT